MIKQEAQAQKEGVLIDFSPEEGQTPAGRLINSDLSGKDKSKSQISLLDEPIDIPTFEEYDGK